MIGEVGAFNSKFFRVKVKSSEYVFCSHSYGEVVRVNGFECFDGDDVPGAIPHCSNGWVIPKSARKR